MFPISVDNLKFEERIYQTEILKEQKENAEVCSL